MNSDTSAKLEESRRKLRIAAWRLWWAITFLATALVAFPVGYQSVRIAELVVAAIAWLGLIALAWSRPLARWSLLAASGSFVLFALWPASPRVPSSELRTSYIAALRRYEGVRYVWGGENFLGLDCSGLARRGLIDTLLFRGISQLDPATFRSGLWLWWHDCSARSLGAGEDDQTIPVTNVDSLNGLDPATIRPGDLAVVESGVHVLAHLENREWIEADAVPMRVVRVQAPSTDNWFAQPVHIVRWRALADR